MAEDIIRRGAERLGRRLDWILLANVGLLLVCAVLAQPGWSLLAGFCASASIEFIQFFIGRSTDIDDVILNTTGALAGFWVFCLLRAVLPNFTKKFQCQPKGGYYRE